MGVGSHTLRCPSSAIATARSRTTRRVRGEPRSHHQRESGRELPSSRYGRSRRTRLETATRGAGSIRARALSRASRGQPPASAAASRSRSPPHALSGGAPRPALPEPASPAPRTTPTPDLTLLQSGSREAAGELVAVQVQEPDEEPARDLRSHISSRPRVDLMRARHRLSKLHLLSPVRLASRSRRANRTALARCAA